MSAITLINETGETVRLALFQRPVWNPTLATVAWQIAAPPPGGRSVVQMSDDFELRVRYSHDPNRPDNLDTSAKPVAFNETTAVFTIDKAPMRDGVGGAAVINRSFTGMVFKEVRVLNNFSIGVEAALIRGQDAMFEPQVIWPGGLFIEDVGASMYVAVVSQFTYKGQRLVQEEISQTQAEVLAGDSLIVTGSMWTGYSLTKA